MDAIDAPSSSPLGDDRPLDGLKVVELATVLAGPLVGTFLAELGAEVIKVEPPGRRGCHAPLAQPRGIRRRTKRLFRGRQWSQATDATGPQIPLWSG